MIKEIVKDQEFLAQVSEPATIEDAQVATDLVDTMNHLSESCACLAANQIGYNKAIIAFADDNNKVHVMYNPKLIQFMGPFEATEGCLSLDEESTSTRYQLIRVAYQEEQNGKMLSRVKKYSGFTAQAIQHAIDHTKGILV